MNPNPRYKPGKGNYGIKPATCVFRDGAPTRVGTGKQRIEAAFYRLRQSDGFIKMLKFLGEEINKTKEARK